MRSALACASLLSAALGTASELGGDPVERAFHDFIEEHHRSYATEEERKHRFAVFKEKYEFVQESNAKSLPYKLTVNEFADQTKEEMREHRLGMRKPGTDMLWAGLTYLGQHNHTTGEKLVDSWDWTRKGAVNMVKNQGRCGSCWAFSATGALEGANFLAGHGLVSLSEQQLVDCDHRGHGCNGGLPTWAFAYYQGAYACSETAYPYKGKNGFCNPLCGLWPIVGRGTVVGFRLVARDNEMALLSAVTQQPVSVGIEADETAFSLYSSGIMTGQCGTMLDHGVLCVGFGTDGGMGYWKIKNSWGPKWGEYGYIRIQRGGKGAAGQCGIARQASYPVVRRAEEVAVVV